MYMIIQIQVILIIILKMNFEIDDSNKFQIFFVEKYKKFKELYRVQKCNNINNPNN